MKNKNLGKYCIVLMNKELTLLNNSLRKDLEGLITLSKTPPHITLRESFFTSKIDELILKLKSGYSSKMPIDTNSNGYSIFDNKYIIINFDKPFNLQQVHEITMNVSQGYIEDFKHYKPIGKLTKRQDKLLEQFNNPFSFEYYNPHSSIGKNENYSNIQEIKKILDSKNLKQRFVFNSVFVVDKLKEIIYDTIVF